MNPVLYTQFINWVGQLGVVSKCVIHYISPGATLSICVMHSPLLLLPPTVVITLVANLCQS